MGRLRARGTDARRRLSSSALIQEDDLQLKWMDIRGRNGAKRITDLVLLGIEETAIFLVASSARTTSVSERLSKGCFDPDGQWRRDVLP